MSVKSESCEELSWTCDNLNTAIRKKTAILKDNPDGKAELADC